MTVDEAKVLAEEGEYDTEPNNEGEIEKRPGKLSDYLLAPYKNDEAARAANNGALPPDLSLIVKARHGGCDYIFSLLTGYPEETPAGAVVQSGLNFNPYFPGTGIAMARALYDGLVEYEDGTSATTSQMAKDVVEFLNWTAEPEADERKKMGWKVMAISTVLFGLSVWVKRCVTYFHSTKVENEAYTIDTDTSGPRSRHAKWRTRYHPALRSNRARRSADKLMRERVDAMEKIEQVEQKGVDDDMYTPSVSMSVSYLVLNLRSDNYNYTYIPSYVSLDILKEHCLSYTSPKLYNQERGLLLKNYWRPSTRFLLPLSRHYCCPRT